MTEQRMTTCTNDAHRPPAEVRNGSDEAWRQWLRTKPACPECGGTA